MAYNIALEDKIEDSVRQWDGVEKKKMFGGICYLLNGNMCFGIWKDYLIVRMAPELAAEKLNNDSVREFDITGKPRKGWIMIENGSWDEIDELITWLDFGRSFALILPKKAKKKKSLEEIYYQNHR